MQISKGFVVYNKKDNSIIGFYRFGYNHPGDRVCSEPDKQTALEISPNHPAFERQGEYKVSDGQLVQKNSVKLTASSPTFPADGTSSVQITFNDLKAPTVVGVAGQKVTVSPSDNVLTLTSDAPRSFTLQINDADQWSEPLTLEAQ